jgi:FtsZ-interacting cell division protein ZipA
VDTATLIWIIIGIIVVAIIIVVAVMMSRRNSAKKLEAQHAKAQDLREDARRTEMAAREREAQAAQARADSATAAAEAEQAKARAAQASIEAERAAATIDGHQTDAAALRAEQAEKLRKADELDPAVTTNAATGHGARDDRAAPAGYTPAPARNETTGATEDRRIVRDNPDTVADRDAERVDREAAAADRDAVRADSDVIRDENGNIRSEVRPTDRA